MPFPHFRIKLVCLAYFPNSGLRLIREKQRLCKSEMPISIVRPQTYCFPKFAQCLFYLALINGDISQFYMSGCFIILSLRLKRTSQKHAKQTTTKYSNSFSTHEYSLKSKRPGPRTTKCTQPSNRAMFSAFSTRCLSGRPRSRPNGNVP